MTDLHELLPSIALIPFPEIVALKVSSHAILICPKCRARGNFYDVTKAAAFAAEYCKGNAPPEIEHKDFLGGSHTHQVVCAGITVEHFHVRCRTCEHQFFVGLPIGEITNG